MIADRLRCVAENNSGRLAIVDGNERIAYGELLQRIDGARAWLDRRLHLEPGDVVLGTVESSWQFVACFFAIAELGGIFMPCHPASKAVELRALAARAGVRGVVTGIATQSECRELVSEDRIAVVPDQFEKSADSAFVRTPALDSAAAYLSTSGSTGTPRIVPRSHGNLLRGAHNVGRALSIDSSRRFLCAVPVHFAYGLHNSLILPLLNGACMILARQFTPGAVARLAAAERADVLFGSPFIYRMLLPHSEFLSSLDLCVSSGARIADSLCAEWEQKLGVRVRQSYGATETHVMAMDHSPERPPAGALGTAIDEVEIRILPDGEIAVRSPMVMAGYVGDPELNTETFADGFYRTGDLGSLDPEGRLKLLGRIRRVINIAGLKVDPVEVERVIESLEGVVGCHVDSAGGEGDGDIVRARIEVNGGSPLTRSHVIAHCRRSLSEHKLPRVIEFVDALPVSVTGKIIRAQ